MTDSQIRQIQTILTEIDEMLRERLKEARLDIGHVLLAIAPDGAGVVRSNLGPEGLGDMAELLTEIASGAALERPESEPLN
jgi:hypothetical protein